LQSISFDRAVGYYDQTRGLPDEVSEQIAASAASQIPAGARVLEIGIGTGRISIPLLRCGLRVSGVDLSILMMKRLAEKLPGEPARPGLIQADAACLPLRQACFDAVFAVHVFHLIAGWQQAANEVRRVLKAGGGLFLGHSRRDPHSSLAAIREHWSQIVNENAPKDGRPGVRQADVLDAYLQSLGAQISNWEAAQWETLTSPAEAIRELEAGVYSSTWRLSPEKLNECGAALRQWAREEYRDLEQPMRTAMSFTWKLAQWTA
jgi:ubiquinone/menaquinone biosynthesis C-methylase UbiE